MGSVDALGNAESARATTQCIGPESGADGGCDGVGIDVAQRTRAVARERRDHRQQTVIEKFSDDVGVDVVDVADETVIDGGVAALQFHRRALMRLDETGVHTADADRRHVEFAAGGENASVDEAAQHHRRGIDRTFVRHATALDHLRGYAEFFGDLRQLRATTMYEDDAYAERVQDGDLLDDIARRLRITEYAAACFHDERLALEQADVRRCATQGTDHGRGVGAMHDHR